MKTVNKISTLILALVASIGQSASAQTALSYVPPAYAAYISSDGTTWAAWTSGGAFGGLSYTPPAVGLYCQASAGAPWTPCVPGGGGSGTVNNGTAGKVAGYSATGNAVGPLTAQQIQQAANLPTFDSSNATLVDVFLLKEGAGTTLTGIKGNTCTIGSTAGDPQWGANGGLVFSSSTTAGISCAGITNVATIQVVMNYTPFSGGSQYQGIAGMTGAASGTLSIALAGYLNPSFVGILGMPQAPVLSLGTVGNSNQIVTASIGTSSYFFINAQAISAPSNTLNMGSYAASSSGNLLIGATTDSGGCQVASNCILKSATIRGFAVYSTQPSSYAALTNLVNNNQSAWEQAGASQGYKIGVFTNNSAINSVLLGCEGTSIEAGFPVGTQLCASSLTGLSSSTYSVFNAAVPSAQANALLSENVQSVDYMRSTTAQSIVMFHGDACTNDIANASITPAACFQTLGPIVRKYKTFANTVLIGTMIDRGGNDATHDTWNGLVRAGETQYGYRVCDIAANPLIGADGAASNTTYFTGDQTHLTSTGQGVYAPIIGRCVLSSQGATAAAPTLSTSNAYTMGPQDNYLLQTPTAAATVTLPECIGLTGYPYTVINGSSSFTITASGTGSETIMGSAVVAPQIPAVFRVQLTGASTGGCYWLRAQ